MQFPLAHAQHAAGVWLTAVLGFDVTLQLVEMVHAVVGHADGADLAGLLGLDEGTPGAEACFVAAVGGVDEVEIDVGEVGLGEGRGYGFLGTGRRL